MILDCRQILPKSRYDTRAHIQKNELHPPDQDILQEPLINYVVASTDFTTEILVVKPVEATIVPKPFYKSSVTFFSLWLTRG